MVRAFSAPVICQDFVGRALEREALYWLIDRSRSGQGQVALVSGEAGIGKSRLVAEAKSYAATQGFLLLQGKCFPTDLTYPYAPLLDLLRSLLASNPAETLTDAIKALARDIFPLLPELVPDQTMTLPRLEPEQEQRRLFAVLATFYIQLSAHSPVLLIIEDAHWSDETSLDFLHTLARRSTSQPLLLLVTYRQDEIHAPLRNWLAQLNRERLVQQIQLAPLARNDIDAMLSAIFDQRHTAIDMRRFLHGELLDALSTLTEGNPFFVEETLSSLVALGDISYVQGYWNRKPLREIHIPRSVQDAVQQRIERLSQEARDVLTLAAVAGRHFDFALLQQLTRYDEEHLLLAMKELVSAQLVIEESAERFAFRHALTRQAIYTQLLTRERTALHRTIAETMEQLAPAALEAHLEELAYHFYQARVWQKAVEYAQRAGEKALRLYSHRAAIDYFTWTLDAVEHLSTPPAAAVYRARGQAYETLGEFEQAQRDYTLAMDSARTMQDSAAEWQSMIDLGFLWAGRDYAQAESWFRQALTLSQALNDAVLHARSLNRMGNWHLNVEQTGEALRYHQEALSIFQELHDRRGIAETLDLLGMVSYLGGDLIGGTDYYRQAIALFGELGDRAGLTSSLATITLRGPTFQTDAMVSAAGLAEVCQDAEQALRIAREIGHRSAEAYASLQLGLCRGSQGEYGLALASARQSLDIAEEIEHREWQAAAHTILGGVYNSLLALPQARVHFEQALALAHEIGSLFWTRMATGYLASVAILLHDESLAEKALHAALSFDTPAQTMGQRMVYCAFVELALAQGDATSALEIIDQLNASSAQGAEGRSGLRVLRLRGEALTALQRLEEAEAAFTMAHEMAKAQGVRPVQWRMCAALGKLYQTQRRNTEAEQAFASARTVIEELSATIVDEALRDNFLRLATAMLPPTPPHSSSRNVKQTFGGLTEREREVAVLIAQGQSNQSIADTLVVTKRTVETHIGHIMFKLGCNSRTQIAVWVVETGLASKAE